MLEYVIILLLVIITSLLLYFILNKLLIKELELCQFHMRHYLSKGWQIKKFKDPLVGIDISISSYGFCSKCKVDKIVPLYVIIKS